VSLCGSCYRPIATICPANDWAVEYAISVVNRGGKPIRLLGLSFRGYPNHLLQPKQAFPPPIQRLVTMWVDPLQTLQRNYLLAGFDIITRLKSQRTASNLTAILDFLLMRSCIIRERQFPLLPECRSRSSCLQQKSEIVKGSSRIYRSHRRAQFVRRRAHRGQHVWPGARPIGRDRPPPPHMFPLGTPQLREKEATFAPRPN